MANQSTPVAVLGNWHLAHVTAGCIAQLGHLVHLVPSPSSVPTSMRETFSKPQLFEPGLDEIWSEQIGHKLLIKDLEETAAAGTEIFFLALDTPVNDQDQAELESVLQYVHALARLPKSGRRKTLVVQSQVPVGTSRKIQAELKDQFDVVSMPENLRLGKAIPLFTQPEFMYLGGESASIGRVRALFPQWNCPVREMVLEEAEMVKHSTNFYLALCVSYSSFLSDICENLGVSAAKVVEVLKLDPRVSPKAPLNPGFGFAGGTLGRDVQALREISGRMKEFKPFGDAVYEINEFRIPRLVRLVQSRVPRGSKIAIAGLTYKVGTDTLRRSHALTISTALHQAGYSVSGFDPKVEAANHPDVLQKNGLRIEANVSATLQGARAAILCTPWPELLAHDWAEFVLKDSGLSFFDLTGQCLAQFQKKPTAMHNYYSPGFNQLSAGGVP